MLVKLFHELRSDSSGLDQGLYGSAAWTATRRISQISQGAANRMPADETSLNPNAKPEARGRTCLCADSYTCMNTQAYNAYIYIYVYLYK